MRARLRPLLPALLCSALVAVCVLVAHPAVEMGVNDDWSYTWSARVLAETGRMTYNGWGAHLLGWQMYLGAVAIRLFGFSFFAVRLSVLLVALGTTALMQRIMVRFGVTEFNAVVGTLAIVLCPIFLPLAFSFMSEVPGLFALLLCVYGCVRAVQARTDQAAVGWLVAAAVANAIGGTARQVDWLGVLVMVPSTAIFLRVRRGVLLAGAVAWLAGLGFAAYCMHWLRVQPYTVIEPAFGLALTGRNVLHLGASSARGALAGCLFLLPISVAFVARYPVSDARLRRLGALVGGALTLVVAALLLRHSGAGMAFSDGEFVGNYVGRRGIMYVPALLGTQPDVMSHGVRTLLTYLSLCGLAAVGFCVWNARRLRELAGTEALCASAGMTAWVLGPFTVVYLLLLATRVNLYDRYLLPLLVMFTIGLLRFYQGRLAARLPVWSIAAVVLVALFTTAGLHDQGARYRARLAATREIEAAGVARTEIMGGLEYDAWTEAGVKGYVNDPHLVNPAGAFRPQPPSPFPPECQYLFAAWSPEVHGRYGLSNGPSPCFAQSEFAPVAYTAWLRPHRLEITVVRLR